VKKTVDTQGPLRLDSISRRGAALRATRLERPKATDEFETFFEIGLDANEVRT